MLAWGRVALATWPRAGLGPTRRGGWIDRHLNPPAGERGSGGGRSILQGWSVITPPEVEGKTLLTAPLFHITALVNIFLNAIAGGIQLL